MVSLLIRLVSRARRIAEEGGGRRRKFVNHKNSLSLSFIIIFLLVISRSLPCNVVGTLMSMLVYSYFNHFLFVSFSLDGREGLSDNFKVQVACMHE